MKISKVKLKHQLWLFIVCSIIIFMVMEFYFFFSFSDLTQKRAVTYSNQIIEQTRRKIDSVFSDIRVSTGIAVNSKLIQEFSVVNDDYKRAFDSGPYAMDLMDYMRSFNSYVSGIVINDIKGRKLYSLESASGDIFSSNSTRALSVNISRTPRCGRRGGSLLSLRTGERERSSSSI